MDKVKADMFHDLTELVLLPKIYCIDDVYIIKKISYSRDHWFDKTDCEATVNHIHLEDFFFYESVSDLSLCGQNIARIWIARLKNEFPQKQFLVYLTVDEEGDYPSCTLRFCLKRENEAPWSSEKTNNKTFFVWTTCNEDNTD